VTKEEFLIVRCDTRAVTSAGRIVRGTVRTMMKGSMGVGVAVASSAA